MPRVQVSGVAYRLLCTVTTVLTLAVALPNALASPVASTTLVRDALGREVAIPDSPQRIVSLFASNTELLAALKLEPRIVGIEDFTRYPPGIRDGRVIVGGRLGFSAEAIARVRPDLVVLTPARGAASTLIRPLSLVGIPVIVLMHSNVEQIFTNLRLLGRAASVDGHAERVVSDLRARLNVVQARVGTLSPVRVYVETGENDRGALQTLREGTYTADAVRLAGGRNVFAGLNTITQVSAEAVIRADPQVIFVARNNSFDPASIGRRPGWQAVSAVREGRVYAIPRALLLIPGPRVVEGVEKMAALLYPLTVYGAVKGAP